ncbi:hypothetical protein COLO4_27720 [Corchorus olitorius]|uniref:Uncharacterized protein n=1 Tax=Corchorus olitorius TaxID=93759 RepID=A0A1R3HPR1_9ROSI|nr:hypothetical protein COLO4_27720 [Corchorus olitorius]
MYVTRPLSWYKRFPAELAKSPSTEGPNSGILVIQDEEEETEKSLCLGFCKFETWFQLPFPQNKEIDISYSSNGIETSIPSYNALFIPVLDQPLSSNRYYVLKTRGSHTGKAFTTSTKKDEVISCFCFTYLPNKNPEPADHRDIYQQFNIYPPHWSGPFSGKSVASDGIPPTFLRLFRAVHPIDMASTLNPRNLTIGEARGLDIELRTRLPEFNFPLSYKTSEPVVVGKWYCPFIFIKDGKPKDQMKKSAYYEMTLEQRWEQVFACDNDGNYEDNDVGIDVKVEREVFRVGGNENEALRYGSVRVDDGVMWFKSCSKEGKEVDIGLSLAIVERMKWEQERFPGELAKSPSTEGPNSGILVIQDEEMKEITGCFGLCNYKIKNNQPEELPFPQNKKIDICYTSGSGKDRSTDRDPVFLIPVLDQPLSSNLYYAKAFTSSKEEEAVTCCFCCKVFPYIKPRTADHHDMYQQFEICPCSHGSFVAKSVVPDGIPPSFLRREGWEALTSTPRNFILGEAQGLDISLRSRLPEFNYFPISCKNSEPVVVGKWYCPYIFIKDGRPKDQMTKSMYYEMTLEQKWEQVFECDKGYNEGNVVLVDVKVEREVFRVGGINENEAILRNEKMVVDGWEQERVGWTSKEEREERIKRVEEFGNEGIGNKTKFGCYILVERKFPGELDLAPQAEGPDLGVLVILDEEAEPTCCFGLCKSDFLDELPFPQNKKIEIRYSTGTGENRRTQRDPAFFVPVLGQPLSSNRYYILKPRGSHKGKAYTSSAKEDAVTCCFFCKCFPDMKPEVADHQNIYQQFEICPPKLGRFVAKSVAPDGVPPIFLRRNGWQAVISTPRNFTLGEAPGLNKALRARLPEFSFPISCKNSEPVVVGKWYCPYIFIKDGRPKDQMTKSMYYEMTLEQRWEQVFACDKGYNEDNAVVVDVKVEREGFRVGGINENEAILRNERIVVDGVMWFRSCSKVGGDVDIGLSLAIVERMKWEQERFGWSSKEERQERIKRAEEFGNGGIWNKFGCYILVERFVLRRMDGSLAFTYDFKHTHQVRGTWES